MNLIKVGFIGGGQMTTALVEGLVKKMDPASIYVADRNEAKCTLFKERYQIHAEKHFGTFIDQVDVIILAVKPQSFSELLPELKEAINKNTLVISVAAGVTIETIKKGLQMSDIAVVRAMPNMPSSLGLGATGLYTENATSKEKRAHAEMILNSCGLTVWVDEEAQISAVVAVAGSSPAYFFYLLEAMEAVGIELGLSPEVSNLLTKQAILGSATLAATSKASFKTLRKSICSPKGTTEQAIKSFENDGFNAIVKRAMLAAVTRDKALAKEIDDQII